MDEAEGAKKGMVHGRAEGKGEMKEAMHENPLKH